MKPASFKAKFSLKSVNGRKFWYRTEDGGFSWFRVSKREVMNFIEVNGVVIR